MKCTILLPTRSGDGQQLSDTELFTLAAALWQPYGGVTYEGYVDGWWTAPGQTRSIYDRCLKMVIALDREKLDQLKEQLNDIGLQLKQQAMYLEIAGYDGIQIIEVKPRKEPQHEPH